MYGVAPYSWWSFSCCPEISSSWRAADRLGMFSGWDTVWFWMETKPVWYSFSK